MNDPTYFGLDEIKRRMDVVFPQLLTTFYASWQSSLDVNYKTRDLHNFQENKQRASSCSCVEQCLVIVTFLSRIRQKLCAQAL